jgi:cobalt-zinc-cadmium resistance protein CzcA
VYNRQRNLYKAETNLHEQVYEMKENELVKQVRLIFYEMATLLEKQRLIGQLDSIYKDFSRAAQLRLETGETNMLEKTTAVSQVQQLELQSSQLSADLKIFQERLKWYLNTTQNISPDYVIFKRQAIAIPDTSAVHNNPSVRFHKQQVQVAGAQMEVEKNQLVPDLTLSYNNLSIRGYQTKDGINQQLFNGSDRFGFYQLSVGLPLFAKATKARIKARESTKEVAVLEYESASRELQHRLTELNQQYAKHMLRLKYFESSGLEQAKLILKNAMLSFRNGDIGYVEWTVLMSNAVNLQTGYIDAVHAYNNTLIEIEFLTGK